MASFMYKRSKRYRNASAIVLVAVLCLAGYKGYFSWQKTVLYAKGVELQSAGNELEAQQAYTQAQQIRIIDYKEQETIAALNLLNPAAALKLFFTSLTEDTKAAQAVNDITLLLKSYEAYQAKAKEIAVKDEASQKRFAEMSASEQIEERFNEAFTNAKVYLTKSLETDISTRKFDGNNEIVYLTQVPAVYYKDEKRKSDEINKLLERYDQARLDVSFKGKSFEEVLKEVTAIRKFYDTNKIAAAWLQPKLDTYAQAYLAKLEKTDLKGFIAAALVFQSAKELSGSSTKLTTYIQTTINKQLERAEQLASTQKFAEAIALYKVLDEYKDTDKEVADAEQRFLESDPQQLLRKAAGTELAFSNMISAKDQAGAKLTAAGILDNKTLVLARLLPNQKIETTRATIDQGLIVKSIQWADRLGTKKDGTVLQLEAASKTRKVRYLAYEVSTPEMFKILDVEADKMELERTGVLIFDNPIIEETGGRAGGGSGGAGTGIGTGASSGSAAGANAGTSTGGNPSISPPLRAYYEYRNGRYSFSRIIESKAITDPKAIIDSKPTTDSKPITDSRTTTDPRPSDGILDIPLTELTSHRNERVRFQATITSVDDNKATVQLSNGSILLTGNSNLRFKLGAATITGIYTGSEEVKRTNAGNSPNATSTTNNNTNTTVTEYKVTVLEVRQ